MKLTKIVNNTLKLGAAALLSSHLTGCAAFRVQLFSIDYEDVPRTYYDPHLTFDLGYVFDKQNTSQLQSEIPVINFLAGRNPSISYESSKEYPDTLQLKHSIQQQLVEKTQSYYVVLDSSNLSRNEHIID